VTVNFANAQRATLSVVGAMFLATVFVGTAVAPAEAATPVVQVR